MAGECLEKLRSKAIKLLWGCIGVPYVWGGVDPLTGLDCSGLIIWILKQLGIFDKDFDSTAHGLWRLFKLKKISRPRKGTLVFYGKFAKNRVTHIAMCIDETWCICASGGSRYVDTIERARKYHAFVRLKKIHYRSDIWGYADPFMEV